MTSLSPTAMARRVRGILRVLRRRGLLRGFWWLRGPRGLDFSLASVPRWRAALEELGPTFVKFGQLLSLRGDLLPPEACAELAKLQDRSTPIPAGEAHAAVEAALGGPIETFFASFDSDALAAASIAQVHAATLPGGEQVVVKIRRPGIREGITSDLALLRGLAGLIERALPESRVHAPRELVEEFSRSISRELDFLAERRAMERFAKHLGDDPNVAVPRVYREISGPRLLVAERLSGRRITDVEGVDPAERSRLARVLNESYLTQIFAHGFFHADPHPGNLAVLPDGRICFHDFGMVGRLSQAQRRALSDFIRGLLARDAEGLLDVLLRLGTVGEGARLDAARADIEELVEEYADLPLRDFTVGELLEAVVRLARRHQIRLAPGFFPLARTVVIVESVTRTLDPAFEQMAVLQERAARFGAAGLVGLASDAKRIAAGAGEVIAALPSALGAAARALRSGRFDLRLRHEKLEEVETRIDRSFNRLTFGVVTAAIIVASSIIMQTRLPPHVAGVPVLGVVGFFMAAVLGFGLLLAILRGGRL